MHSDELLGDWLDREQIATDQDLSQRVSASLPVGWRDVRLSTAPELFVAAASAKLTLLLEHGCETRASAADLLTVDALVTYACETMALSARDVFAGATAMVTAIGSLLPQPDAPA